MCGISVIVDPSADPRSAELLLRMHAPIRHRGPDGERAMLLRAGGGTEVIDDPAAVVPQPIRAGMAFRRLKIIDLSERASQPMASPDGQRWIAFNGEIYNFQELRRELESRGRRFATHGDTEVALAAYEAWELDAFRRLEGMWGIVVLDLLRRTVVMSRDRFGIKPLYWSIDGGRLLIASEIKQIIAARTAPLAANARLVRMHLSGNRYPATEETFFEGIQAVPPATCCEMPLDSPPRDPRFRTYWSLSEFRANGAQSYAATTTQLRELLERAVDRERVADVTVGALLSGGLDSAILTGLLAKMEFKDGRTVPTVSLGFRDRAPEFCELRYVDSMKNADGIVNYETSFDAQWVLDNAERVIAAIEEPPLAFAALAQYRAYQVCREHGMKVVIDGQGADEIFGGYPYHERLLLLDRLSKLRIGDFMRQLRAIGLKQRRNSWYLILRGLIIPYAAEWLHRDPWLSRDYGRGNGKALARPAKSNDRSLLNRRLHFDVTLGNVKIVLGYGDRNSMAHSIESRVPYFDRQLIEFAFTLPDSFKVFNGERKRILREVARAFVPPEITERADRMGYASPETRMIREQLWPHFRERITDPAFTGSGFVNRKLLDRHIRDFEQLRHNDARSIWRMYALSVWASRYGVRIG